jgi:hypothetical protein
LRWPARAGLVARGLFYLLLASLAIRVAVNAPSADQADPNGALRIVADQPLGTVVLGAAAFGFVAFAIARLVAAVNACTGRERNWWDVVRTSAETVTYAVMGVLTATYIFGDRQEGSEQSHRSLTARLLGQPGGRALIVAIGVGIIAFYGYQSWVAASGEFEHNFDEKRMPSLLRVGVRAVGTGGIAARVIAFVPVGVFLVVAAVTHNANHALGLDATLRYASKHWWGIAVLSVVAVGLIAFGVYSFLEAAYRKVVRA